MDVSLVCQVATDCGEGSTHRAMSIHLSLPSDQANTCLGKLGDLGYALELDRGRVPSFPFSARREVDGSYQECNQPIRLG